MRNISCEFHVVSGNLPWHRSRLRPCKTRPVAKATGYLLVRDIRWKGNGKMKNGDRLARFHRVISQDPKVSLWHRRQKQMSLVCKKLVWKSQGSAFQTCCKLHMYFGLKSQAFVEIGKLLTLLLSDYVLDCFGAVLRSRKFEDSELRQGYQWLDLSVISGEFQHFQP